MKRESIGFISGVLVTLLLVAIIMGNWWYSDIDKYCRSRGSGVVCPAPGVFEREVLDCLGRDGVILEAGNGAECVVWSHEIVKNRTKINGE